VTSDELYTFEVAPSRSGTSRASLFTIVAMTLSKSRLRSYRKPSTLTTARTTPSTVAVMTKDPNRSYNRVVTTAPMPHWFRAYWRSFNGSPSHQPKFIQYIITVTSALSLIQQRPPVNRMHGEKGDLGPEGLTFISAQDSPNGKPLLAVANEVSGTTTLEITIFSMAATLRTWNFRGTAMLTPSRISAWELGRNHLQKRSHKSIPLSSKAKD